MDRSGTSEEMKSLLFIIIFGFIGLKLSAEAAEPPAPANCEPVTESRQSFEGASITAGEYNITFVAVKGRKSGSTASGRMWLQPTSPTDKSPRTGQSPAPNENIQGVPLYGWTDVNLSAVAAPMGSASEIINPESRDPIFPGVLVLVIDWDEARKGQIALVIGTLSNRRTTEGMLDGAGIGLFIEKLDSDAFAGSWGPWGLLMGGSGHFCARRISS